MKPGNDYSHRDKKIKIYRDIEIMKKKQCGSRNCGIGGEGCGNHICVHNEELIYNQK